MNMLARSWSGIVLAMLLVCPVAVCAGAGSTQATPGRLMSATLQQVKEKITYTNAKDLDNPTVQKAVADFLATKRKDPTEFPDAGTKEFLDKTFGLDPRKLKYTWDPLAGVGHLHWVGTQLHDERPPNAATVEETLLRILRLALTAAPYSPDGKKLYQVVLSGDDVKAVLEAKPPTFDWNIKKGKTRPPDPGLEARLSALENRLAELQAQLNLRVGAVESETTALRKQIQQTRDELQSLGRRVDRLEQEGTRSMDGGHRAINPAPVFSWEAGPVEYPHFPWIWGHYPSYHWGSGTFPYFYPMQYGYPAYYAVPPGAYHGHP